MAGDLTVSPALPAARAPTLAIPVQIQSTGSAAAERFVEFFIANIRNPNTRRAYHRAVMRFFAWGDHIGLETLGGLRPLHVATYIEGLTQSHGRPCLDPHHPALQPQG